MSNTFKTAKGTELPIMNLRGKDYLEVKYRLVWFREDRPTWSIETEFVEVAASHAFAKATVRDEAGRVVATSHKFEDKQGFGDFREKAETGAIGRALALIGYGTQFAGDELDEGERIVDSPVQKKSAAPGVKPQRPGPNDGNTQASRTLIQFGSMVGHHTYEYTKDELETYLAKNEAAHNQGKKRKPDWFDQTAAQIRECIQLGAFKQPEEGMFHDQ
jgi:hypothetical protein